MPADVIMPALGMAQETGKLLRWLRAEGDQVAKGEPLMEVETDKVTVEIEAPADGILGGVTAGEGEDVPVGQAIAFILAAGETAVDRGHVQVSETGTRPRRTLASPKARRLARENGVPIEEIAGSGPYGAGNRPAAT